MIIPYLSFQGNCEEAISLYASVLGGKVQHLSRFTEQTGGTALAGKVMHMQMTFSGGALCGADQAEPVRHGESINLLIHLKSAAEANRIFDGLAAGGQAIQPLTPHPPPDDGGMGALVRDRFGYVWILTAPREDT